MRFWTKEMPFIDIIIPDGSTQERVCKHLLSASPTIPALRHMELVHGWRVLPHSSQWDLISDPTPSRRRLGWRLCGEPKCSRKEPFCTRCYDFWVSGDIPQECLGKSRASLICNSCPTRRDCQKEEFTLPSLPERKKKAPSPMKKKLLKEMKRQGFSRDLQEKILKTLGI